MKNRLNELTTQRKLALVALLTLIAVYLRNGVWLAIFGLVANLFADEMLAALKVACALLFGGFSVFYGLVALGVLA